MLPLTIVLVSLGALYALFAFVSPPAWLEHFFRVPGIFVFLPERWVVPVGRCAAALLLIGVGIFLYARFG
ncbi:MAG: hypothetical protein U1F43_18070 [Myxococcota bacterium]